MKKKVLFAAMTLFCVALFSCGGRQSGEQSSGKPATGAPGGQPTPTPSQDIYSFRRKGSSGPAANSKPPEGIKQVEGNIKGLIVQKGAVKESQSKDSPPKTSYTVSYELTNGSEIAAIDEEGVHQDSDSILFLNVSQEGTAPDDNEVLEAGMNISDQGMMPILMARTPGGGLVVRVAGKSKLKQRTNTDALIGEYRLDPQTKKGRIIPALEVTTDGGIVTIPVQNIPKFKEKPK